MWLVAQALAAPLSAERPTLVTVTGMDCAGCEAEIAEALRGVPGVSAVVASFVDGRACVTVARTVEEQAIRDALGALKLEATAFVAADACPGAVARPSARDPWADVADIDLKTVSTGEDFALADVVVPGRFTLIDFGAPWCGPCHAAVKVLHPYVQAHPDVAVRAVSLAGANASAAFATPAAKRWLVDAPGIPWLVVVAPDGKVVYRGQDAADAIRAIDRRRG
jgi:copper chaperone CopZ/thiol-disulfide isomerase/thioredoxin